MASKTKATRPEDKEEAPEKEPPETPDAPLLLFGLSDAAVRKMIKAAKKRGYVTHEQINSVLPSEEVTSEQIEDILAMLNEVGITTVESEEAEPEEEAEAREEPEEEESEGGELAEVQRTAPAKVEKAEPSERTDDPVRMYLREMGSVELLSREGEIAVAKRIEAGREAAKATSTRRNLRTRCRSLRSKPSSSRRCWRPSTRSPTPTSGCAGCRTRTSRTGCATHRSRRPKSASTKSSQRS